MKEYGFQLDPEVVRVDIFKESGKWYTTVELKFDTFQDELIHDVFKRCMKEQHNYGENMKAVCLHPYHMYSHPLMITL